MNREKKGRSWADWIGQALITLILLPVYLLMAVTLLIAAPFWHLSRLFWGEPSYESPRETPLSPERDRLSDDCIPQLSSGSVISFEQESFRAPSPPARAASSWSEHSDPASPSSGSETDDPAVLPLSRSPASGAKKHPTNVAIPDDGHCGLYTVLAHASYLLHLDEKTYGDFLKTSDWFTELCKQHGVSKEAMIAEIKSVLPRLEKTPSKDSLESLQKLVLNMRATMREEMEKKTPSLPAQALHALESTKFSNSIEAQISLIKYDDTSGKALLNEEALQYEQDFFDTYLRGSSESDKYCDPKHEDSFIKIYEKHFKNRSFASQEDLIAHAKEHLYPKLIQAKYSSNSYLSPEEVNCFATGLGFQGTRFLNEVKKDEHVSGVKTTKLAYIYTKFELPSLSPKLVELHGAKDFCPVFVGNNHYLWDLNAKPTKDTKHHSSFSKP